MQLKLQAHLCTMVKRLDDRPHQCPPELPIRVVLPSSTVLGEEVDHYKRSAQFGRV